MAHVNYNGQRHKIADSAFEWHRTKIREAIINNEVMELEFRDDDGDLSVVYVMRGIPVSVHEWDPAEIEMPQIPEIPSMPRFNIPGR